MRYPSRHRCRGMTLLELLIAVAVFAVLAGLAYGGLNVVLSSSHTANSEAERLANVQRVLARMAADIEQMANRPVRDAYGDTLDSVLSDFDEAAGSRIEFTRHGRHNPAGRARSSLQRIAYQLRKTQLIRESWTVLDRAQDSASHEADMLDGVRRVHEGSRGVAHDAQDRSAPPFRHARSGSQWTWSSFSSWSSTIQQAPEAPSSSA